MANVLFSNVRILDGSGAAPYAGEVLVQGNRITRVARGARALPTAGVVTQALAYMGVTNHLEEMVKGVVAVKDLVFYLTVIAFGLFLTHQSVQSQRWRA